MNLTPEQKAEKLDLLPQGLVDILYSSETTASVRGIIERYNLNEDQGIELAVLVGNILKGFEKVDDVRTLIKERTGVLGSTIDAIAAELEGSIFAKARPFLEELFGEKILVGSPTFESPAKPIPGKPRVKIEELPAELGEAKGAIQPVVLRPPEALFEEKEKEKETQPKEIEFKWETSSSPTTPPSTEGGIEIVGPAHEKNNMPKEGGPIDLSKV